MPIVARVPVGNWALKAPLRKGKEMAVRVMMVERKISKAMKDHAPNEDMLPNIASNRLRPRQKLSKAAIPSRGIELKRSKRACQDGSW